MKIQAGWGEADITCAGREVELAGQYYKRVARGIHSELKAAVLALEQGGELFLMAALDVVGVPFDYCRRLQNSLSGAVRGLEPKNIIINAIHTHSAPGLRPLRDWWEPEPGAVSPDEFRDIVEAGVVEAASSAFSSLRPVGISHDLRYAPVGRCRRAVYENGSAEMYGDTSREDFYCMEGGEDSGVELMWFFEGTRPAGVIVNVACPAQVMEATHFVSSDYMGALREKLKGEFGKNFFMIPQVGASGCQSPRDLTRDGRDFWNGRGVEIISARLFEAILRGKDAAAGKVDRAPDMRHKMLEITLPRRHVSYTEYASAERELEQLDGIMDINASYRQFCGIVRENEQKEGFVPPYDSKLHHFVKMKNCEAVIKRYREQAEIPGLEIESHVLRLGDAVSSSCVTPSSAMAWRMRCTC